VLDSLTPLEDTWLYQEIFAKGKIEGIKGQINLARSLFEQGFPSKEKYEEVVQPLELQLALTARGAPNPRRQERNARQ
jgi:hypothetical protein